ncbi:MAG: hypothetical protein P0S96_05805 [Simkaniaceae bacterium]|nr:hypothetical protein [Candidatus Sacchlamyda saccharinae]
MAAAAGERTWNLPERIIDLSEANTWKEAVPEWSLRDVEILDPGEFDQCLCGHKPIRQLCHIQNSKNGKLATVGNCCIKKFTGEDLEEAEFAVVPRIVAASGRMLANPRANANEPLIALGLARGFIGQRDATFYEGILTKRSHTQAQARWKASINDRLLYGMLLSKRAAYTRLKEDVTRTAGPKLAKYAFERKVLSQKDYTFYQQVWGRSNLTVKQMSYRTGLNRKIVRNLAADLGDQGHGAGRD